jgi:hypothetical protein
MKVDKVSVSFPHELGDAMRAAAQRAGTPLSSWLAEAAEAKIRAEALAELLEDWAKEDGPLTEAELADAGIALGIEAPVERRAS